MERKPSSPSTDNQYFTADTERYVDMYLSYAVNTSNPVINNLNAAARCQLFAQHIAKPLRKLVEGIIRGWCLYNFDTPLDDVIQDVMSFLIIKLDSFDRTRGRAFSYLSTIAKHYLIHHSNDSYRRGIRDISLDEAIYKKEKYDIGFEAGLLDAMSAPFKIVDIGISDAVSVPWHNNEGDAEEVEKFLLAEALHIEQHLDRMFTQERDKNIAMAVVKVMRNAGNLVQNSHKKLTFALLRNLTGEKQATITRCLAKLKQHHADFRKDYDQRRSFWNIVE